MAVGQRVHGSCGDDGAITEVNALQAESASLRIQLVAAQADAAAVRTEVLAVIADNVAIHAAILAPTAKMDADFTDVTNASVDYASVVDPAALTGSNPAALTSVAPAATASVGLTRAGAHPEQIVI